MTKPFSEIRRNDAAERLRATFSWRTQGEDGEAAWNAWLDDALAAERRATVERIRAAMDAEAMTEDRDPEYQQAVQDVLTILDAEAKRYDANDPDEVERAHLYGLPDAEAER